jgi:transposase
VQAARRAWSEAQTGMDTEKLAFVDETWASTNMTRSHGRGPMDGEMFLAWVRQFLCPALQPGDIVILDNLSSHKVDGVQQALAAAGATALYLPPYLPDLNSIEKLFPKHKSLLRKAAKRSLDDLRMEIGQLLNTISSSECANYFISSERGCSVSPAVSDNRSVLPKLA